MVAALPALTPVRFRLANNSGLCCGCSDHKSEREGAGRKNKRGVRRSEAVCRLTSVRPPPFRRSHPAVGDCGSPPPPTLPGGRGACQPDDAVSGETWAGWRVAAGCACGVTPRLRGRACRRSLSLARLPRRETMERSGNRPPSRQTRWIRRRRQPQPFSEHMQRHRRSALTN